MTRDRLSRRGVSALLAACCLWSLRGGAASRAPRVTIGTRGSPLALAQAEEVRSRLSKAFPSELGAPEAIAIRTFLTSGDLEQHKALASMGGKGLFTKELDEALLHREVDLCVHSVKDVPTRLVRGTTLRALLPREDVRDAFLAPRAQSLDELPINAVVGTASLRRAAQTLIVRPDLKIVNFRGNLDTRLAKLRSGVVDATFLALAGLKRLAKRHEATAALPVHIMVPAVGQGAIGLQVREDDEEALRFATALNCEVTARQVTAERSLLLGLNGDCRMPIAASARLTSTGSLVLTALVASPDGRLAFRVVEDGAASAAAAIGAKAAEALKWHAGEAFFDKLKAAAQDAPSA
eukprot:Selendium_serpulae@DN9037_c0_g1_i1.p1